MRVQGSIDADLNWSGTQLTCVGAIRPNGNGLRIRFAHPSAANAPNRTNTPDDLVLVFGISGLQEGQTGHALPVNLTIIREGQGEFFATQGDDKCTADEVTQTPLQGIPLKQRSYAITVRGFCTQPARAVKGDGLLFISRFDFYGRADFASTDTTDSTPSSP